MMGNEWKCVWWAVSQCVCVCWTVSECACIRWEMSESVCVVGSEWMCLCVLGKEWMCLYRMGNEWKCVCIRWEMSESVCVWWAVSQCVCVCWAMSECACIWCAMSESVCVWWAVSECVCVCWAMSECVCIRWEMSESVWVMGNEWLCLCDGQRVQCCNHTDLPDWPHGRYLISLSHSHSPVALSGRPHDRVITACHSVKMLSTVKTNAHKITVQLFPSASANVPPHEKTPVHSSRASSFKRAGRLWRCIVNTRIQRHIPTRHTINGKVHLVLPISGKTSPLYTWASSVGVQRQWPIVHPSHWGVCHHAHIRMDIQRKLCNCYTGERGNSHRSIFH